MSNGNVDIEWWITPYGWEKGAYPEEPESFILEPNDAQDLFDYLRKVL